MFAQKSKFRGGTCSCCVNPGNILSYFPKASPTPKDKWAFKAASQNLCTESHKAESQYGNKKHPQLKIKKTIRQWLAHVQ